MSPEVEEIRSQVEERIRELRPVIDELEQLQGILAFWTWRNASRTA